MSSSTERKSPQNFITEMQEQLTVAETAHPCVAVTEPNWKAMISTQRSQIDLLKEIRDTLPTLTTEKELKVYMDRQLKLLMQYTEQTKEATEQFQAALETSAAELTENIGLPKRARVGRYGLKLLSQMQCRPPLQKSILLC